ncbi:Zinc-binding dehydrogenase [Rhizoctonia solani]|uniref:Zinc-binding dehydrogenase n=1 Tax=Rhizoctonia solani TaxID=456999 RepID=A0A8H8P8W0_9AGAM|nr:Zinc-binding dehydrogenase [Rhizoctonia solani]QRW25956.1 Zinc-binding dehydrogenase [Rhizoctonia solani]
MSPVQNSAAIFNSVPQGYPVLNETITHASDTIDLDNVPLSGGTLVKSVYLSIDPYMRGRMRKPTSQASGNFVLGQPIRNFGIGKVIRSEKDGIHPGDLLYVHDLRFQVYNVLKSEHPIRVIKDEPDIPLSAYIGVLGMPGMTAFYGLEVVGNPVKGETIFVSSGASAVGSLVVQLAKAKGLKVIASVGSDDKVDFLKSIGVDAAFNYKTQSIADVLAKEGPIDIYWDNVGGPTLEAALDACNTNARIVVCGAISQYNASEPYGIKNTTHILYKQLTVRGFGVLTLEPEYEGQANNPVKFLNALVPLIQSGKIKWSEQIYKGIESAGEGIIAVQTGSNPAKVVIEV